MADFRIGRRSTLFVVTLVSMVFALAACAFVSVTPGGDVVVTMVDTYGRPLAGVDVLIGDDVVTTDANGEATFPDIADTYDMALHYESLQEVRVYLGFETRAPVIRLPGTGPDSWPSTANLAGYVTNLSSTTNSTSLRTGFLTQGFASYGSLGSETAFGVPYSTSLKWSTNAATTVYGYAVEVEYAGSGDVLNLRGAYETQSISPSASGMLDLPLEDYTLGQISGSVTAPSGYDHVYHLYGIRIGLDAAGFVDFGLEESFSPSNTFDHVTMELPAPWSATFYSFEFFDSSSGDGGWAISRGGLGPNQTGISVHPTLAAPSLGLSDGATLNAGDVIDLGANNSTFVLSFEPSSPSATSPNVLIIGTGDEIALPDLSTFGSGSFSGEYSAILRRYSLPMSAFATEAMDDVTLYAGISTTLSFDMNFTPTVENLDVGF